MGYQDENLKLRMNVDVNDRPFLTLFHFLTEYRYNPNVGYFRNFVIFILRGKSEIGLILARPNDLTALSNMSSAYSLDIVRKDREDMKF
jgi:hypothetical protein